MPFNIEQFLQEEKKSLAEAAELLGFNYETTAKWSRTGSGGVILETLKIGNKKFTTREAIVRFLGQLNCPAVAQESVRDGVEDELDAIGL